MSTMGIANNAGCKQGCWQLKTRRHDEPAAQHPAYLIHSVNSTVSLPTQDQALCLSERDIAAVGEGCDAEAAAVANVFVHVLNLSVADVDL